MKKFSALLFFIGLFCLPQLCFADAALIGEESQTVASGSAGIAFDASTSDYVANTGGNTVTFSHTVGTGSDRFLVVITGGTTFAEGNVTGVTYNGDAMSPWWDETKSDVYISTGWYLTNPDSGTHDVVVTINNGPQTVYSIASSFTGVHQSSPVGTAAEGNGYSDTPTVDVTAVVGDWVIDGVYTAETDTTKDASQTLIDSETQSDFLGMSRETATTTTVTMSWTQTSGTWCMGAGAIKPAD